MKSFSFWSCESESCPSALTEKTRHTQNICTTSNCLSQCCVLTLRHLNIFVAGAPDSGLELPVEAQFSRSTCMHHWHPQSVTVVSQHGSAAVPSAPFHPRGFPPSLPLYFKLNCSFQAGIQFCAVGIFIIKFKLKLGKYVCKAPSRIWGMIALWWMLTELSVNFLWELK